MVKSYFWDVICNFVICCYGMLCCVFFLFLDKFFCSVRNSEVLVFFGMCYGDRKVGSGSGGLL